MARRSTDIIQRFLQDYSGLSLEQRGLVHSAIRGFEYQGTTPNVTRRSAVAPRTPRTATGATTGGSPAVPSERIGN